MNFNLVTFLFLFLGFFATKNSNAGGAMSILDSTPPSAEVDEIITYQKAAVNKFAPVALFNANLITHHQLPTNLPVDDSHYAIDLMLHEPLVALDYYEDKNNRQSFLNALLILSANAGKNENIAPLIQAGAQVNATDNQNFTAIVYVALKGNPEIAKILIQNGAHTNILTDAALLQQAKNIDGLGMLEKTLRQAHAEK